MGDPRRTFAPQSIAGVPARRYSVRLKSWPFFLLLLPGEPLSLPNMLGVEETSWSYLFHYICQDRIVYLCITDDDFERSRAFSFLNEVKKRFQTTYGSRAQTALPYAMNSEFSSVLAAQLKHHSENKSLDKVMETQAQVDELKGIMVRNIDLVAQRGERLELLIDKTENLVDSSVTFKTTSRNLARAMCMKNIKLTIIIIIVSIVFIYIIVSLLCGGFTWPNCVKK